MFSSPAAILPSAPLRRVRGLETLINVKITEPTSDSIMTIVIMKLKRFAWLNSVVASVSASSAFLSAMSSAVRINSRI